MAIQYHLSAFDILQILGYQPEKENRKYLEQIQQKYNLTLPKTYCDFMEYALFCPLFETSNLWTIPHFLRMFYDDIADRVAELKEDDTTTDETDPYYIFVQTPREKWSDLVCDYFLIGSDYGSGAVTFGIRCSDLEQADPPLYWQHEMDDPTYWRYDEQTISQFFTEVLLNTLSCSEYNTAEDALEEIEWRIEEYYDPETDTWNTSIDTLEKLGIQYDKLQSYKAFDGSSIYACYEIEKNILYVIYLESAETICIYAISPMDTECVFCSPWD